MRYSLYKQSIYVTVNIPQHHCRQILSYQNGYHSRQTGALLLLQIIILEQFVLSFQPIVCVDNCSHISTISPNPALQSKNICFYQQTTSLVYLCYYLIISDGWQFKTKWLQRGCSVDQALWDQGFTPICMSFLLQLHQNVFGSKVRKATVLKI